MKDRPGQRSLVKSNYVALLSKDKVYAFTPRWQLSPSGLPAPG
jgi:hypothetical protein